MDSVLLSLSKLPKRGLIVDLCAGNGAVGLLQYSDRGPDHWCQPQERLADMATRSGALNGLNQQISMITDDLKHLPQHIKGVGGCYPLPILLSRCEVFQSQ